MEASTGLEEVEAGEKEDKVEKMVEVGTVGVGVEEVE